jgi:hypothetical protein
MLRPKLKPRALADAYDGGSALPETTGRFLEELEIAVHQFVDRALDRW